MPSSVLPQVLMPDQASDKRPAPRAGSPADVHRTPDQDSRFDAVSRAEQQRLEARQQEARQQEIRQQTSRLEARQQENRQQDARQHQAHLDDRRQQADQAQERRQAKQADDKSSKDVAEPPASADDTKADTAANTPSDADGQPGKPGKADKADESEATAANPSAAPDDAEQTGVEGAVSITFADLRALLKPAAPAATPGQGAPGSAGPVPAAGGTFAAATLPGLAGLVGGPAGLAVQGKGGTAAGMGLGPLLGAVLAGDGKEPGDRGALTSGLRFQGALELAGQTLNGQAQSATPLQARTDAPAAQATPLRSYATSVDVPVGQADWGDKVMGKLSWLTAKNLSTAEIHLTPPDMGPMDVKVRMHNDQATITVHTANPVVRDQLEGSAHRLRDMLSDQGLSLAQFDVSDQPGQQAGREQGGDGQGRGTASGPGLADAATDGDETAGGQLDLSWKGEVDVFA